MSLRCKKLSATTRARSTSSTSVVSSTQARVGLVTDSPLRCRTSPGVTSPRCWRTPAAARPAFPSSRVRSTTSIGTSQMSTPHSFAAPTCDSTTEALDCRRTARHRTAYLPRSSSSLHAADWTYAPCRTRCSSPPRTIATMARSLYPIPMRSRLSTTTPGSESCANETATAYRMLSQDWSRDARPGGLWMTRSLLAGSDPLGLSASSGGCRPKFRLTTLGLPGRPGKPHDEPYVTGRLSKGVERTMVVRVETLAAERISARRFSRSPGVPTRTLRM